MEWVKVRSNRKPNWANKRVTTMAFRINKTKQTNKNAKKEEANKQTKRRRRRSRERERDFWGAF